MFRSYSLSKLSLISAAFICCLVNEMCKAEDDPVEICYEQCQSGDLGKLGCKTAECFNGCMWACDHVLDKCNGKCTGPNAGKAH